MIRGNRKPRSQQGQALVVFAITVTVILAATAVVLDGGNGMGQGRGTQNAADAAALAGAVVIAEKFGGASRSGADVHNAMNSAFTGNLTTMGTSYYVDFSHNVVGTIGGSGSIPNSADGVLAHGSRTFDTFLAGLVGQSSWTSGAQATALAGTWQGGCSAEMGCAVLPVVFSIPIITCDGTNQPLKPGGYWPVVSRQTAEEDAQRAAGSRLYEAIVPLCTTGPGGVGWIEMIGCTGNLADQVWPACNTAFTLPVWMKTSTGDSNNVENVMNRNYAGGVVLIPMFDATCRSVPSTGLPRDCTDPGDGDNLYYHVPQVTPFLLDQAHIQGGNHPECNQPPGSPYVGGNGSTSCIKGWFVNGLLTGQVGEFIDCNRDDDDDCAPPLLSTQLVR